MKRTILLIMNIWLWALIANAQATNQNYIRTRTYLDENQSKAIEQIAYFDGLGRPIQSVQKKITPFQADLVTFQEYDAFGRESAAWLPVVATGNNGAFMSLTNFKNKVPNTYGDDEKPFTLPVYEESPLNRVLEQYGPGKRWHDNKKPVRTEYLTNTDSGVLACKWYKTTDDRRVNAITMTNQTVPLTSSGQMLISGGLTLTTGGASTYYPVAELHVTKMSDEEGNEAYEFKEKLGQVVLTRQMDADVQHDTYYIYDNFGNLRAVLPPLAADRINEGTNLNEKNNEALADYAYLYKYDYRNRMIEKKLPGCDPVKCQYDKADRMIFSQDGEQRLKGEWTFYLYDAFGRLAVQGMCSDTGKPDVEGLAVKTQFDGTDIRIEGTGYTCNVNIVPTTLAVVNYYDDYGFIDGIAGFDPIFDCRNAHSNAKGFLTGSITFVTEDNSVRLCSTVYYDFKGNPVKTISGNHLGGHDITSITYSFTNQPLTTEQVHTIINSEGELEKHRLFYRNKYDHANRLKTVMFSMNPGDTVILADNEYDELGRLQCVRRNNRQDLANTYAYNIRSWTTNITGTQFSEDLEYADNGNVALMKWIAQRKTRNYAYAYDGLSRLTSAVYTSSTSAEKYDTEYSYDKHGNITGLKRYGKTTSTGYGLVDNLSMRYSGNQLLNVSDAGVTVELPESNDFKKGNRSNIADYAYNKNGAMAKDLNKKISEISYNSLNLPKELTIDGVRNEHLYAANGSKLRVKQGEMTRDYVNSFIYENRSLKRILFSGGYWEDGEYYFNFSDHLGNIRAVADANGNTIQENGYYPFGLPMAESSSTEQEVQPYKFGGKEFDRENGLNLYDFEARMLDPGVGRFTSVDPMAEKYYGWSPYVYVMGNPLKFIDPNGEEVYMIFYATNDERFKAAAETRQREIESQKGFDKTKDRVYIQEMGDLGTLGDRVNSIVEDATNNGYGLTVEASFWGHSGSEDGPRSNKMTSGKFATTDGGKNQLTGEGWSKINFNFDNENSLAAFYGCNSASYAQKFFNYQPSVAFTAGIGGSAGPSYSTGKFDSVSYIYSFIGTSKSVYYGTSMNGNFIGPTVFSRRAGIENFNTVAGNAHIIQGKPQNIMR